MLEDFPSVRSAYEVVKSVGFDWETSDESGNVQRFTMRVDVVRLLGEEDLAPMVWQVADQIGDVMLLHTRPENSAIRGKTVEEVVAGVIRLFESPKAESA